MFPTKQSVRHVVKRLPGAQHLYNLSTRNVKRTLARVPLFDPNSAGTPRQKLDLALQAAEQTFPLMAQLLSRSGQPLLELVTSPEFADSVEAKRISAHLKTELDAQGSDKAAGRHDYHWIYGRVFADLVEVSTIVEVGLGTNNEDVVSHMGIEGRPGASLRAFRDALPGAQIYGADVDKRVLFEEERIQTYFVDQTDMETVDDLAARIPDCVDLIIDDGLHSPNANLAITILAIDKLRVGGWLIIEDIAREAIPLWQVVASLLRGQFEVHMIQGSGAIVFAARRSMA